MEIANIYAGVKLSRAEIAVAQQYLELSNTSAAAKHVGRAGVAQKMRCDSLF